MIAIGQVSHFDLETKKYAIAMLISRLIEHACLHVCVQVHKKNLSNQNDQNELSDVAVQARRGFYKVDFIIVGIVPRIL